MNELVFIDDVQPHQQLNTEKQPEKLLPYLGRQTLGGLEKVAEIPSNIFETLSNFGQQNQKQFEQTFPGSKGLLGKSISEQLPIPKAEQIRSRSEKALGYQPGSFTPQGLFERIAQEAVSTGALTAVTGGIGTAASQIKPIIGSAVGGNVLQDIGSFLGLPEDLQTAMHISGSLWGSTLGTKSKVVKSYNKAYKQAEEAIKPNSAIPAPRLNQVADDLLEKTSKLPGYEKIEPTIKQFKELGANQGRVNIKDAWAFKKRLNELYAGYPKDIRNFAVNPMLDVLKNDVLNAYGKLNKNFGNPYLLAEKDFAASKGGLIKFDKFKNAAAKASEKIVENPEKFGPYVKMGLKAGLYGIVPFGSYFYDPLVFGGVGGFGLGARELNKFSNLVKNSPTAQNLMSKSIKDLWAGNTAAALSSLNKMDKILEKENKRFEDELVFI